MLFQIQFFFKEPKVHFPSKWMVNYTEEQNELTLLFTKKLTKTNLIA